MVSFLMLPVLLGAFAVGIPLVVHLLHRQRVTPIPWGAMQFLLETPLKVRRRRRIDNWLLMLVRMAIVLLLALLLARPVMKVSSFSSSTPTDVVVVIDHSLSMGMREPGGKGTLFDQGVDVAEAVSKMLPASGTMSVVLAENVPKVILPTPLKMGPMDRTSDGTAVGAWGESLKLMRGMKPGMTKGNMPAAIGAAREVLTHGYNNKKVILVVSDQQRTNWEPGNDAPWKAAVGDLDTTSDRMGANQIYSYPVKLAGDAATIANVSVRGVTVLPAFIGVHRPAQILATVTNSGGKALSAVPVSMEVDGKLISTQTVANLAAGDSTTVPFEFYFPEAGSHWVRMNAGLVDALEADNSATAAVQVKPRLPVLVVDGQLTGGGNFPAAEFLVAAMQPVVEAGTVIDPKVVSAAELATMKGLRIEDFPIVVVNDVPRLTREVVDRLAAHAQAGNGVWVILGPRTEEGFVSDVLGRSTLVPLTTSGIVKAELPVGGNLPPVVSVEIKEASNGALAWLSGGGQGEHQALAGLTMRAWWKIVPGSGMRTVLATTTGDPLVAEMSAGKLGGNVVVWTSSVGDLTWNNMLAQGATFVPLVQETLFHLASGQDSGQPRQVEAGEPITWSGPSSQVIESVTLVGPDGGQQALQPQVRQDHYYVEGRETALPGLYEMRFTAPAKAGAVAPPATYFSVNIDPQELEPGVLSVADVEWLKGNGYVKEVLGKDTLPKALEASHGGIDLWWILGVLMLGCLVMEVFMTYRLVRQQAGVMIADAVT